jgi:hypothetical protein
MGNATTLAPGGTPPSGPCKITKTGTDGVFQAKAAGKDVIIQLCHKDRTIATECSLNSVAVYVPGTPDKLPDQPSKKTNTDFTLHLSTLSPGTTYRVVVALNPLPGCTAAYLYEACAAPVLLVLIAPPVQPVEYFYLKVV